MLQVYPLDEPTCLRHIGHFLALDRPYVEAGMLEEWTRDHFLHPLEDKWSLSSIAWLDGQVVGYRIVSAQGKLPNCCHSHRTSVGSHRRRQGIGEALLKRSVQAAAVRSFEGMTGMCLPKNVVSKSFLKATGWKPMEKIINGNELWYLGFGESGDWFAQG